VGLAIASFFTMFTAALISVLLWVRVRKSYLSLSMHLSFSKHLYTIKFNQNVEKSSVLY